MSFSFSFYSTVRNQPLDQIDPSLAIGFYCRDEGTKCFSPTLLNLRSNSILVSFVAPRLFEFSICCSDDFKDFCLRASELGERSNGAPLFTVSQSRNPTRSSVHDPDSSVGMVGARDGSTNEPFDVEHSGDCDGHAGEDDWQLL